MTGYEAYQIFEHLRDTGTIQAAGEMFGQAVAKGFVAEAAKLDKEIAAAPQLADALEGLDLECEPTGPRGEHRDTDGNGSWPPEKCPFCRARAALRAAGRLP